MTKLTISEAAKLTPHNRQTLYKHAKSGQIDDNQRRAGKGCSLTSAELQRVYGNLNIETPKTPEADDMRQAGDTRTHCVSPDS